ncbi:MAG: GIY-YIG nuclease family protein, partial [Parcubacteria group bacterium]|nr:GIY-YIG nuclease family protein [Parcubacteria group bacterium]
MIAKKPTNIPSTPGVYLFRNRAGQILYIGKAANLKNRLSSYFGRGRKDPRIGKMLQEANSVECRPLDSEIEAFLTEAEMIKGRQPPYNIAFRDDKRYFYVVITNDIFPKIHITHQPATSYQPLATSCQLPVTSYIGPFVEGSALRTVLKFIRRIFPYCNCRRPHNNYCLNYHLGRCPGFCCLKPSTNGLTVTNDQYREYKDNVKAIKEILGGRKNNLVAGLEKEMKQAGENEDFEAAIDLRNKLEKIKTVLNNARVIKEIAAKDNVLVRVKRVFNLANPPRRIEGYDVSNIQGKFATGAMVVFVNGNPEKDEYRKFRIRTAKTGGDIRMLKEVLARRFRHPEWQYPDLIIVDGGKAQF